MAEALPASSPGGQDRSKRRRLPTLPRPSSAPAASTEPNQLPTSASDTQPQERTISQPEENDTDSSSQASEEHVEQASSVSAPVASFDVRPPTPPPRPEYEPFPTLQEVEPAVHVVEPEHHIPPELIPEYFEFGGVSDDPYGTSSSSSSSSMLSTADESDGLEALVYHIGNANPARFEDPEAYILMQDPHPNPQPSIYYAMPQRRARPLPAPYANLPAPVPNPTYSTPRSSHIGRTPIATELDLRECLHPSEDGESRHVRAESLDLHKVIGSGAFGEVGYKMSYYIVAYKNV